MVEEVESAARANNESAKHDRSHAVGKRSGSGEGELAGAAGCKFLAFRIGVGEQTSDGQQEDGAETDTKPGGDEQAGNLAYNDGSGENKEEGHAASFGERAALRYAEAEAHDGEEQKEGVDAQFDAKPSAQWD